MAKKTGNRIKNEEQYEELRDEGMSESKFARIANTKKTPEKKTAMLRSMKNDRKRTFIKKLKKLVPKVEVK